MAVNVEVHGRPNFCETESPMSESVTASPVVLETDIPPLSRSVLWRLQREWFDRNGADAWRRGVVPYHVTTNPVIASAYVDVVVGYWRDLAESRNEVTPPLDPEAPVYVVELGGGSGRFTFHFLRRLAAIRSLCLSLPRVRYVFTDFTSKMSHALPRSPAAAERHRRGSPRLRLLHAEDDTSITLVCSGKRSVPARCATRLQSSRTTSSTACRWTCSTTAR